MKDSVNVCSYDLALYESLRVDFSLNYSWVKSNNASKNYELFFPGTKEGIGQLIES